MRLLHLSDPHFGAERPEVVEALVALAQAVRPDAVILSGDITQRARSAQFRAARACINRLGIARELVIPGNHDIPLFDLYTRLLRPYVHHQHHFGAELEPVLDTPQALMIGVNTTRRWRHKDGDVSPAQIEYTAALLSQARPQQLRIVITHQPVHVYRQSDAHNLLHGHRAAIRRWSAAGADLVLGGHIHLPYVCALHDADPTLPRRLWCVQAGTAVSRRVRPEAPNSVNLIDYDAQTLRCRVERWDHQSAQGFARVQEHRLDLDRRLSV